MAEEEKNSEMLGSLWPRNASEMHVDKRVNREYVCKNQERGERECVNDRNAGEKAHRLALHGEWERKTRDVPCISNFIAVQRYDDFWA